MEYTDLIPEVNRQAQRISEQRSRFTDTLTNQLKPSLTSVTSDDKHWLDEGEILQLLKVYCDTFDNFVNDVDAVYSALEAVMLWWIDGSNRNSETAGEEVNKHRDRINDLSTHVNDIIK